MILEAVDVALKEYGRIDYLINGKEYFYDVFLIVFFTYRLRSCHGP